MELPEPTSKQFSNLMNGIETGSLKIPQFQRDFVWDIKKSAALIDSVVKGYPIGTFILWKTKESLRAVKNIGRLDLPEPNKGDYVQFVLDGQQRITSIFATLKGETIKRDDNREENFSNMYVGLEAKEDEKIVTTEIDGKNQSQIIKLNTLLEGDFTILGEYDKKYHDKLKRYKQRIESYSYSVIQVNDAPIDVATEIFTRINVGGKALSTFQIMVAKTYDYGKNFDLVEKFEELTERLENIDYETISEMTVLQTISLIIKKECKRKIILSLQKEDVINHWQKVVDSVENAAEYFKNYFRIPTSSLLPYDTVLVPFAYFFYHNVDKPLGLKQKYLEDFFWRVSLSERYSSAVESKLSQDVKRIDMILNEEQPRYDWQVEDSPDYIKNNGLFNTGRSYIKAILCIYAYQQPKSFADNSVVNITNNWLKRANSKNYHHFFPKAFLKKLKEDENSINHILNITLVDDYLNKRKIQDRAPSDYMEDFKNDNDKITETMKTHLIHDLEEFGIWSDDYQKFLDKRANALSAEIKKRIIT
ncbi:MAG: DUF262 domain-containing protein [Thaumarchaeota archaeon]|nr:DUF262 domain-containing protein [Nitrososphaerota archaeon]